MTDPVKKSENGDSRPGDRFDRSRAWLTGIGLGALVLAAMVASFEIGSNQTDNPVKSVPDVVKEAPAVPTAVAGPGRDLFISTCGGCHTLSEAGTSGTVGPDLDLLAPSDALVKQAIAQGGTGTGQMPPGLLTGADADDVAKYVSTAAGTGG